jgi:hypothetical protein
VWETIKAKLEVAKTKGEETSGAVAKQKCFAVGESPAA